jgi:hypothetical protein
MCRRLSTVNLGKNALTASRNTFKCNMSIDYIPTSGILLTALGWASTTRRLVRLNVYIFGSQMETRSSKSKFHPRRLQLRTFMLSLLVRSSAVIASCGEASTASQNTNAARKAVSFARAEMHWLLPEKYCSCGKTRWGGGGGGEVAPMGGNASVGAIWRYDMVGWRFKNEISESVRVR